MYLAGQGLPLESQSLARPRPASGIQMANAMTRIQLTVLSLVSGILLLLAAGCGGGGGSSSLGGLNVFISDDMGSGYDQIWVRVHQIDVQSSGGGFTTVFSSAEGVPVDVTNLTDGAPKFLYMGNGKIAAGEYTGMRVTMSRNLTLVPTGSTTGEACTFDASFDFGTDQTRATFGFGAPVSLSSNDSIIVDFDLPNWNRVGNVVTPAFKRGDDSTLGNPLRHEDEDYHGTVASLNGTAPDQTFTLSRTAGSFQVTTDTNTIIFREDTVGSPALANSQRVEVRGTFDVNSNSLLARVIKIEDNEQDDDHKVEGTTSDLDTNALTVVVAIHEAEGFLPQGPSLTVQFSSSTRFFTKAGAPLTLSEMLTFLATGIAIEAEGTYASGNNTLTATKIKLHPEDGDDHEAEAKGAASNLNAGAGTFDLTLSSWYGFSATAGQVVAIVTTGSTTFRNDNGDVISANDFFAGLQAGQWAEVEGSYDSGTLTADKAKLEDEGGGGGGQPEAEGYVTASNLGAGTFTISLVEWFGFNGSPGAQQVVQTTGSTEFLDGDGNPMTQANFFAGLTIGKEVDAKGSYSGGVLTATRARYKD